MGREEVREKLRTYRALDNDRRLNAFLSINEQPGISFNELARKMRIERGLLAYHLGVLKASGLIDVTYVRRSRETSQYKLTKKGEEVLKELSAEKEPKEDADLS
jgi:predicted transcriptional regulator